MLRQSRLGMIGFIIVVLFAFVAILAPLIAPFPRTYLAPDVDRFENKAYTLNLPANLTFEGPVLGPTTPLSNSAGAMWELNYNRTVGVIYMNLLESALGANESPFQPGNYSRLIYVSQNFTNLSPPPGLPLESLYYIVPATLLNATLGPAQLNGAIAFFSGQDFVAADPFTGTAFFRDRLSFTPVWTGEDPLAGGNLLIAPLQRSSCNVIICTPVGPYEYFYASNGTQTVVYEVQYGNAWSVANATGSRVFTADAPLSAPPFVYYNPSAVTAADAWRSGPGQGIFVPLANGTLEVADVTGTVRAFVPLSLNGAPAVVDGNISFTQSQYPLRLYLPLRSANATGMAYLDLNTLTLGTMYTLPGTDWRPLGQPFSRTGSDFYSAWYNASANDTFFIGATQVNATTSSGIAYSLIPQFQVHLRGLVQSYFYSFEQKRVFVLASDGKIFSLPTAFSSSAVVSLDEFPLFPPTTVNHIAYGGSFHGTLYGLLSNQELWGVWTDSANPSTVAFQLLGSVRTPLPPGTYPSGKTYLWGTDFFGGDILTEWIYGTQIAFVVGLLAAFFSVGIGTLVGVISGYYGKTLDTLLMRTTDVFLVLPFLPIVLVLISIVSPSIWIIILVIAILGWPGIARVIRSQVLSLKERPFVDAARVSGASDLRLVFLHIAPNVLPFSFLYMSLNVGGAIITEAALSFLGFGDPTVTSWGGMLSNLLTFSGALHAWWWLLPPGLGITFLSLGFYLIGRGFDEIINPRLRRR